MPKIATELRDIQVSRLRDAGLYAVGGVVGLYLQVKPPSRTWVFRYSVNGKRRDMGLGPYPTVTLSEAREAAKERRKQLVQGLDPLEARDAQRQAERASKASRRTFQECAEGYIRAKRAEWKNAKHLQQWENTLAQYAYPVVGNLWINEVTQDHVLTILEPIWQSKTETAKRLQERLSLVLDWAIVRGFREQANPAKWRGQLDKLLASPSKIAKVSHHAAMRFDEVPGFFEALSAKGGMGAKALKFTILTAGRSGEVLGAVWDEIDLEAGVWTVPAERMKAGKTHRVPLSSLATELLRSLPRVDGVPFVFPSARGGGLSNMTLTKVMRDLGREETVHGFRSAFRDWAAERTPFPRELAEHALSHVVGDEAERAYARSDLLEKRRRLMEAWAKWCRTGLTQAAVVPLTRVAGGKAR